MAGASCERTATMTEAHAAACSRVVARLLRMLTVKRITSHGMLLALCMWSAYAIDLANPGLRDRAGHIKCVDFLHFYTGGWLVHAGRGQAVYDPYRLTVFQQQLVPQSVGVYFASMYGPQVYLAFSALALLPYTWAALVWALLNCCFYFGSCYAVWRTCPSLRPYAFTVFLLALAFPGFFDLVSFGQSSGPALFLFTLAFLALRSQRKLMAGLAIGTLIYKPQLALASAVVFVLASEWKIVAGAIVAAAAQLAFPMAWLGREVVRRYFQVLLHPGGTLPILEQRTYQFHSVRGFWLLLVPSQTFANALYVLTAAAILVLAVMAWRSRMALGLRYSALLLATVLVSPHLGVYDFVVIVPALLLLADWILQHPEAPSSAAIAISLYLCYALPLLESLAKFTHLQLSVIALVVLEALVWSAVRYSKLGAPHLMLPNNEKVAAP